MILEEGGGGVSILLPWVFRSEAKAESLTLLWEDGGDAAVEADANTDAHLVPLGIIDVVDDGKEEDGAGTKAGLLPSLRPNCLGAWKLTSFHEF
jgi:hypothetical protein